MKRKRKEVIRMDEKNYPICDKPGHCPSYCKDCRFWHSYGGINIASEERGKCELTGETMKVFSTCTRWQPK